MHIQQLISPEIPSLKTTDTGDSAIQLMQELQLRHLPLVEGEEYVALLQEDDLLNWDTPNETLNKADFLTFKPVVYAHQHPYEAVARANQLQLSAVPVLNEENKYSGVVTTERLLQFLVTDSGLDRPGGIIVLGLKPVDYSLSEIARICENNDAVLLNVQVFSRPDTEDMEVVLKTNTKEIQGLVAAFERYEYHVIEHFGDLIIQDSLLDRYNSLMHYLNM